MKKNLLIITSCIILTACNSDVEIDENYQHVRVYKDDQALSCNTQAGIPVRSHGEELLEQNIEIHCSQKGNDGFAYPEICGGDTGSINIFTIHKGDLATAESIGFSRLATLPDATFDQYCEYQVISDHRKYHLLDQLYINYHHWQSLNVSEYKFTFNYSYTDCPTFVALPRVEISVVDDEIIEVINTENDTLITMIDDYFTIEQLFSEINVLLQLTPIKAGITASEPYQPPEFDINGVPRLYFIDSGQDECDAIQYGISDVEIITAATTGG